MKKLIIVLIGLVLLTGCWDTGTGDKIGVITRLNKQGVFCKTWEGEIIRGGMNTGTGVMGQAFHFTIENDELAQQVQDALDKQLEVKIEYRSELVTFCRSDSPGNYLLTSIEIIESEAHTNTVQDEQSSVVEFRSSRDETIDQLLQVQARLIEQLSKASR